MIADVQNVYAVLKVYRNDISNVGDWSNGMTEVSKTLSGSSILSSPAVKPPKFGGFFMSDFKIEHKVEHNINMSLC